jgi:hypothetical protein
VAPAILAILVSDRLIVQLVTGWGLGAGVTALGLLLAYVKDLSTGPAVIAVYGVVLLVFAGALHVARSPRRGRAVRDVVLVTAGFAIAGAALFAGGRLLGARYAGTHAHAEGGDGGASPPAAEADPATEAGQAIRLLEAEPATGAARAVRFLEGEPPPFFRAQVTSALREAMGEDPGFLDEEPMDSPANQKAIQRVRVRFGLGESR